LSPGWFYGRADRVDAALDAFRTLPYKPPGFVNAVVDIS
jgi:hypothetical protein